MMKKKYSCDICRDPKEREQLMGCKFSNLHNFTLDGPDSTDGVHICFHCLQILKRELQKVSLGAAPDNAKGG